MEAGQALFYLIFAAIVCFLGYKMFRHGGFKVAMFGAKIEDTVGEVPGEKRGPMNVALKVHTLRGDQSQKLIGLELVAKSFASYQMMPITLSVAQARQLATLLENATRIS